MNDEILDEIGFTQAEKKVYLTLIEIGSTTAAPILEKTGLQNSVFYRTIHRLLEKGYATFIQKGKIKHYQATDPSLLLTVHKEREKRLQELVPQLQAMGADTETEEVVFYKGWKGVVNMHYEIIEDAQKGENFYFLLAKPMLLEELQDRLYRKLHDYRVSKGVNIYGIGTDEARGISLEQLEGREIRFVSFPIPQTMMIFRDRIALIGWGDALDKPRGVLIRSREIANQYGMWFKQMWKVAKP